MYISTNTECDALLPRRVRLGAASEALGRPSSRPGDRLGLEVLLESGQPVLPADAALLVTAEGHVDAVGGATVDAHHPAPHPTGHGHGPIRRPDDVARQAVVAVVGDADGVVVIFVGDETEHGTEDLLPGDRHRIVHVDEEGRLDEPALREVRRTAAARGQLRTFGLALLDV